MHTGLHDLGRIGLACSRRHLVQQLRGLKGLSAALQVCQGLVHMGGQGQLVQVLACTQRFNLP